LRLVGNEAPFAEAIHKKTDSGSSCANHFRQLFLIDLRNDGLQFASVGEASKQQKSLSQPLFAGVEKLIHYDFLVSTDAGKQVIEEKCCKRLFILNCGGFWLRGFATIRTYPQLRFLLSYTSIT
jgi:hypothetical protein